MGSGASKNQDATKKNVKPSRNNSKNNNNNNNDSITNNNNNNTSITPSLATNSPIPISIPIPPQTSSHQRTTPSPPHPHPPPALTPKTIHARGEEEISPPAYQETPNQCPVSITIKPDEDDSDDDAIGIEMQERLTLLRQHSNKTHDLQDLLLVDQSEFDTLLLQYTGQIFRKADMDGKGNLCLADFTMLALSPTLKLSISESDAAIIFAAAATSNPTAIYFEEFRPVMVELLIRHSESALRRQQASTSSSDNGSSAGKSNTSWQWFCMHFDNTEVLPAYFNIALWKMTYDKPTAYCAPTTETQTFSQYFVPSVGKVLTTSIDETGAVMMLDWDSGTWKQMPKEWAAEAQAVTSDTMQYIRNNDDAATVGSGGKDSAVDEDTMERFTHPTTGVQYESVLENGKRLYFDDTINSWEPIPVFLEQYVPAVVGALRKMGPRVPAQATLVERILALRLHNYDVHATIGWFNCDVDTSMYENGIDEGNPDRDLSSAKRRGTSMRPLTASAASAFARAMSSQVVGGGGGSSGGSSGGNNSGGGSGGEHSSHGSSALEGAFARAMTAATSKMAEQIVSITSLGEDGGVVDVKPNGGDSDLELCASDVGGGAGSGVGGGASGAGASGANGNSLLGLSQGNEAISAAMQQLFENSLLEIQKANTALVDELHRRLDAAESSNKQRESEVSASNNESAMLRHRVQSMEHSLREATEKDSESSSKLIGLQDRVASLQSELQMLNEGGNWKTLAEDRAVAMSAMSERVAKVTADAANMRAGMRDAISGVQFAISNVRKKLENIQTHAAHELNTVAPAMLQEFADTLLARMSDEISIAVKDLTQRYRYEARQRKLLYNKLQELKGNIRVFCRIRRDDRVRCVLRFPDAKGPGTPSEIQCPYVTDAGGDGGGASTASSGQTHNFEFDRVYNPDSTQEEVFEDTEPIITSCVDGYNVCIIAYGQTGSGKTFTMMGTPDNEGVNRRAVRELIKICNARKDTVTFAIKISLLEIYNEKILDLLAPTDSDASRELGLDPETKLPFVKNRVERQVTTVEDVMKALADADENRHVASTKMNSTSSRSHLLLQLVVNNFDTISRQSSVGKLTLVDLAGSERIAKTEATGQRLIEAAAINKSLTALGQVFAALRTKQSHIPYRNSKLTHLLQDSMGGDAKTCVFVNASPAESNLSETIGTLKFGSAIRTIELADSKTAGPKKK